jgi:hypothetical protein
VHNEGCGLGLPGQGEFFDSVTPQMLVLKLLPFQAERTIEEMVPTNFILLFYESMEQSRVCCRLNLFVVEPLHKIIYQDCGQHFSCLHLGTPLLDGANQLVSPLLSTHPITWSLSLLLALQMGHSGDAVDLYQDVMVAVGSTLWHILTSWVCH